MKISSEEDGGSSAMKHGPGIVPANVCTSGSPCFYGSNELEIRGLLEWSTNSFKCLEMVRR